LVKAVDKDGALAQAIRKELAEEKLTVAGIDLLEKQTPGKGLLEVRKALLAKSDDTLVGVEAATVILAKGLTTLRNLGTENPALFGPDKHVGSSKTRKYSIGRLRAMQLALDERDDALLAEEAERRAIDSGPGHIERRRFRTIDDLNGAFLAGLSKDGKIVEILVRLRVSAFDATAVDHYIVDGLHDLLTGYIWEDPDLLLDWQNAFREVAIEWLTDGLVEAHADSSETRLRMVFGEGGQSS